MWKVSISRKMKAIVEKVTPIFSEITVSKSKGGFTTLMFFEQSGIIHGTETGHFFRYVVRNSCGD